MFCFRRTVFRFWVFRTTQCKREYPMEFILIKLQAYIVQTAPLPYTGFTTYTFWSMFRKISFSKRIFWKRSLWCTGVNVSKYSPRKNILPSNYLLGNNYSVSTYLIVNKYSLQEISAPLDKVWSYLVFSHLNTPGNSIFLGNLYSLVKPLYWNKRKQPLK